METLNGALSSIDDVSIPDGTRGFYFNILSWHAYRLDGGGSASNMLKAGDAAITTMKPARDAIHYYPLVPRQVLGVMPFAPRLHRIYLPPVSNAKYDAVSDVRASLRDGSLARLINATMPIIVDARTEADKKKAESPAMRPLFQYDVLSANKKIHEEGELFEKNRGMIDFIMDRQMEALLDGLFPEGGGDFVMFPHLNLLMCDLDQDEFDSLFHNPLAAKLVNMRVDPILRSLRVDRKQQLTSFENEGMFRVKEVKIKMVSLWEKYVENSSFSQLSLTYWSHGESGQVKLAEDTITMNNPLVFAIPADFTERPAVMAWFKILVGIKSSENMVFITLPSEGRVNGDALLLDSRWPELFIVRPAVVPRLDLNTVSGEADDIANFKPVIKFIRS